MNEIFTNNKLKEINNKKILIIGGTGFIGSRLIEVLFDFFDVEIKVLVRNFITAIKISQFPIKLLKGSVNNYDELVKAMQDTDIVINLAYSSSGNYFNDMKNAKILAHSLAKASLHCKINKLIHISTISTYKHNKEGVMNEKYPQKPSYLYGKSKLKTDKILQKYYKKYDLPVIFIQPTIVYGPYSNPWTLGPCIQLLEKKMVIPDNGDGVCNPVYVDDVVQAILLASLTKNFGEKFLISGLDNVTWGKFYNEVSSYLGKDENILLCNEEQYKKLLKNEKSRYKITKILKSEPLFKSFNKNRFINKIIRIVEYIFPVSIKKIAKESVSENKQSCSFNFDKFEIVFPTKERKELLTSKSIVEIIKSQSILGYYPKYTFKGNGKNRCIY